MNVHAHLPASSTVPQRHQLLLEVIRERRPRSQEELQALLAERGVAATQSTLSRDLKTLGVVKTAEGYALTAELAGVPVLGYDPLEWVIRQFVVGAEAAVSLVVVRTVAAGAHPVAQAIDAAGLPGVVGTIAGEDTVFLACRSVAAAVETAARLERAASPRDARDARHPRTR